MRIYLSGSVGSSANPEDHLKDCNVMLSFEKLKNFASADFQRGTGTDLDRFANLLKQRQETCMPRKAIDMRPDFDEILEAFPEIKSIHPACLAVPEMSAEDFQELYDDIEHEGLKELIDLTPDGELVDGKYRACACLVVKVKPRFNVVTIEPWRHAWSMINRRHMTPGQKLLTFKRFAPNIDRFKQFAAERSLNNLKRGDVKPDVPDLVHREEQGRVVDKIAKATGVSKSSVIKFNFVDNNCPELLENFQKGQAIDKVYKEATRVSHRHITPLPELCNNLIEEFKMTITDSPHWGWWVPLTRVINKRKELDQESTTNLVEALQEVSERCHLLVDIVNGTIKDAKTVESHFNYYSPTKPRTKKKYKSRKKAK